MSAPTTPIPGAGRLAEEPAVEAPFSPCIDLRVGGEILATLFYDDKPECAHASVEVERDDGTTARLEGAEAGLDEKEVGWCLQFTDEPEMVHVVSGAPADWHPQACGLAWTLLFDRIRERGIWEPAAGFRLWRVEMPELPGDSGPPDIGIQ